MCPNWKRHFNYSPVSVQVCLKYKPRGFPLSVVYQDGIINFSVLCKFCASFVSDQRPSLLNSSWCRRDSTTWFWWEGGLNGCVCFLYPVASGAIRVWPRHYPLRRPLLTGPSGVWMTLACHCPLIWLTSSTEWSHFYGGRPNMTKDVRIFLSILCINICIICKM